ncbi:uncharacterized protein loco isoform X3 [Macrobrachium rosenbergii]|uniref:uncharacterized protein loco isoform X3 n=1 Tax=Macrobrachium rosenbergii TaxID=79674 RepID=UPI0034D6B35F
MPGLRRAPDVACRSCPACRAFDVLRSGLRSVVGSAFPLTSSHDRGGVYTSSGRSRRSSSSSSSNSSSCPWKRGMGSTRPAKPPATVFIHGTFKGPVVVPSSPSPTLRAPLWAPMFPKSRSTLGNGTQSLSRSSSSSGVVTPESRSLGPSSATNYPLGHSSSAYAVLTGQKSLAPSSTAGSTTSFRGTSSQGSLGSVGQSVHSLWSSSHSLASTVVSLTPHASAGSLVSSVQHPSESNALTSTTSSSSVPAVSKNTALHNCPTSSSSIRSIPVMSKNTASRNGKMPPPESVGIVQGQPLGRSSSAVNWREAFRQKKSVVLYDSQKSKISDREGILPMLRSHVFRDRKPQEGRGRFGEAAKRDAREKNNGDLTEIPTKDEVKSTAEPSKTKDKAKNRRNGLRRFTTSVLPSHIFGFAKNSGRNVRKHEGHDGSAPGQKEPPLNPAKVQRLSSVTEQSELEVNCSVNSSPLDKGTAVRSGNGAGRCSSSLEIADRNLRPIPLANGKDCPRDEAGRLSESSELVGRNLHPIPLANGKDCPRNGAGVHSSGSRSADGGGHDLAPSTNGTVCSRNGARRRNNSLELMNRNISPTPSTNGKGRPTNQSTGDKALRDFVPLGMSASCSAIVIKPTPAPRTIFPSLTTPALGLRTAAKKTEPEGCRRIVGSNGRLHTKHLTSTPISSPRKTERPTDTVVDNDVYHMTSSLDDSYTSHRCYLTDLVRRTPAPPPPSSSSSSPHRGPLESREDIPWITTPPGGVLKGSRSLFNVGKENEVEGSSEKKWARSNSLRRPFHRARDNNNSHGHHHHQDPAAHSDTEIGKISAPHSLLDGERGSGGGSVTSERAIDVGRVAAWAASFEKLLEDPAGLHTFAEFLKKEYSHENIYFWTACERYKRLSSPDELQAMAKVIFERHLCIGASEPVNVDSQARQDAQDSLHNPNEFLFSQAQKQIFNLMKFDSYSRFLKSNLYQDCLASDMRGQTLPYPGDETMDPDLKIIQDDCHVALKKSKSDADERRRKSLLPWHRKDRSKSKDRGEAEYRRQKKMGHRNQSDSSSVRSDMSGSRTSLNSSSDLALGRRAVSKESLTSGELGSLSGSEGYHRCRVILPDLSNSVVAVRHGETIQELLTRLLERRGISYSTFEVYQNKTDKLIDKNDDSVILGGMEVRIERRVLFRLDLPNRKTVCIKARPNKLTSEVLKPILHKYSYKLDLMSIHKVGEEKSINLKAPITEIDGDRLVVQTKEEVKEWGIEPARQKKKRGNGNTLDEITNRVFEDLLKGKSEQNFDELGILDFDARSSRTEHSSDQSSSGVTGGFGLRNSAPTEKDLNKSRKPPNRASVHDSLGVRGMPPPDHALISKRRGMGSNTPNPNDELYEGLKRAQRSRLDDQRGTEINFELPDFLKCDDDQPEDKENQRAHLTDQLLAQLECSFSDGGVIPTHREADDYFSIAHPEVWGGIPTSGTSGPHSANATLMAPDLDLDDFDDTLVAGEDSLGKVVPMPDAPSCPALHMDPPNFSPPPPLPPKPKLGGTRGPPPRPPSRQLHPFNPPTFSSTSDDDGLHHSSDPPIHLGRQSISFV